MNIKVAIEKIWHRISDFTRKIVKFFYNAFKFRKELAEHSWWDYHFTLLMLKRSLIIMKDGLQSKGNEVIEQRKLKIEKISRVIQIIDNIEQSNYITMAELELGELKSSADFFLNETPEEKEHNSNVFKRSSEIEKEEWDELWNIIKGKSREDFLSGKMTYDDWFDGSDMRGWWD